MNLFQDISKLNITPLNLIRIGHEVRVIYGILLSMEQKIES
jgi:hypothetical protein